MQSIVLLLALWTSSILALPAATTTSSAGSVCHTGLYELFLPLSNFPLAESFCSSKYPVAPVTTTSTVTPTTTSIDVIQVPSTTSLTTSIFTTVITTDITTIEITTTETDVVSTETYTTTSTSSPTLVVKRAASTSPISSTNKAGAAQSSLYSSLSSALGAALSTACSCIEAPAATVQAIVTGTSTVTVISTSYTTYPTTQISTDIVTIPTTTTDLTTETDVATTTVVAATTVTDVVVAQESCVTNSRYGNYTVGCNVKLECPGDNPANSLTYIDSTSDDFSDCMDQCTAYSNANSPYSNGVSSVCTGVEYTLATGDCLLYIISVTDTGPPSVEGCASIYYSDPGVDSAFVFSECTTAGGCIVEVPAAKPTHLP